MATKKWLSASLTLTISFSALISACSSKEASSSQPAGDGSKAQVPATFKVISNDGGYAYAKQSKLDDPYTAEMSKLFSEYIGQPTTIQYEFIPAADYTQQVTVRFAANDIPDVVTSSSITDPAHPTAVENGIFLPLNDLIDKYGKNLKAKIPQQLWQNPSISKDGKIYAVPKLLTPINPTAFIIRKDWLDKLGMKQPETLDEFLAFFEAVKNTDLNGNGQHDEIGYPLRGTFGFSNEFFYAFGVSPGDWHEVNGQFIPDIINPKMKDAIKFYKQLYDKGYVNKDFLSTKDADWVKLITGDKVATWSHDLRNLNQWTSGYFDGKSAKIDLLPGFKQPSGQYLLGPRGLGVAKLYMINSKTKHPERFIQFLDWTYSDEAKKNTFFRFGINGRNYTEASGQINYDPNADVNANQKLQFETMINPSGDMRMDPEVVKREGVLDPALVEKGISYEQKNLWDVPSLNMPALNTIKTKPELGAVAGSLFLDTVVKIMTGKADPDKGFDDFVANWKKRGGDDALKEAADWYSKNKKSS